MKKLYLLRVVKMIALLLPIILVVLFAQEYLFYFSNDDTNRVEGFYSEAENSLDVVMLGSSEIYGGFSPVYAYQYGGLTSYNYCFGNNPAPLYRYEVEEILKRQNPQMILLEVLGFLNDEIMQTSETYIRVFSEHIPRSCNWFEAIMRYPYEDKLSCLFPFFKYHGQWQMSFEEMRERILLRSEADPAPKFLKGARTLGYVSAVTSNYDLNGDTTVKDLDPMAEKYLREFLEYCTSEGIDNILFVRFPHQILNIPHYDRFCRTNRVWEIVESYGYSYLDLQQLADEIGIETMYDFSDPEHLGIYGQIKLTEYLCDVLMDEYGVEPQEQTAENQEHWDSCIPYMEAFVEIAQENLEAENGIILYEEPEVVAQMEEKIRSWEQ